MPSYDSNLFNIEPYFDDFDETKNFQKLLFRPSYAVQARELSQIQSILQNQIERFGNHIFKDGSKVYGAEGAIQTVDYLKISTTSNLSEFIGFDVTQGDNRAKVIHAETIDEANYLFVQTLKGELPTGTISSNAPGVIVTGTVLDSGSVRLFSVSEGIFFVDGFFVRTGQQYAANIDSHGGNLGGTADVAGFFGFDINRNYVGSNTDATLLDPARGYYNENAPGADRYQLNLDLNFHVSDDRDDFVPLAIIDSSGTLTQQTYYSDYSEIEKTLAKRTFDESGSYVTDPFELDLFSSSDESKISLNVGSGKAYIYGYEFENQSAQIVNLDKARDTQTRDLTTVKPFELQSYISMKFEDELPIGLNSALSDGFGIEKPVTLNVLNSSDVVTGQVELISVQKERSNLDFDGDATVDTDFYRFYFKSVSEGAFSDVGVTYSLSLSEEAAGIIARGLGANFVSSDTESLLFPVDKGLTIKHGGINQLQVRMRKTKSFTTNTEGVSTISIGGDSSSDGLGLSTNNFSFVGPDGSFSQDFVDVYYHVFSSGSAAVIDQDGNTISDEVPSKLLVYGTDYTLEKQGGSLIYRGASDAAQGSLTIICTLQYIKNSVDNDYLNSIRRKVIRNSSLTTVDGTDVFTDEKGRDYILLNHADVIRIKSVVIGEEDPRSDVTFNNSVITDFTFDNGQRDYSYEYGRLYFTNSKNDVYKDENGNYTFQLVVDYDYFEHDGSYGFITVDSYPVGESFSDGTEFKYEDIPLYTSSKTGGVVSLTSCIDFRFIKDVSRDNNGESIPPDSSCVPVFQITQLRENDVLKIAHEYFVPRIDKLVLRRDFNEDSTKFTVLKGNPDLNPKPPADEENSLTLYRLIVPPYTHNINDVEVEGVSHRRYTMSDIGEVDKRLERVELFSSLSSVESKIDSITYLNESGNELEKRCILVDNFNGHEIGDVSNEDYKCSIDFQNKELRPSFNVYNYETSISNIGANLTEHSNGIITAATASNGITFASQLKATKSISVNPFQLTNWVGSVSIKKPNDAWFDDKTRPIVKTNVSGENNAWAVTSYDDTKVGFGSQWNDWEAIWSGIPNDKKVSDIKLKELITSPRSNESLNSIRSHFEQAIKVDRVTKQIDKQLEEVSSKIQTFPEHITKTLRNKVVDLSVVPYMRSRDISIDVDNMKPNTDLNVYLDNTLVNSNILIDGTLTTDDTGKLRGLTLSIPNSTFSTGQRILRFIDNENDPTTATTIAEGVISSQGVYETSGQGVSSVRPVVRRRQTIEESAIPSDVNTRKNYIRTSNRYQWLDPLSQTFFVDESLYPKGLFLEKVCLYFSKKDSTLPVTVQIRPTKNGYPHPSAIVPFSEKVIYPDDVSIGTNGPTAETKTEVKFDCPLYLEPGEYAICITSNSTDYEVYSATIGETELNGTNRIQKEVYSGRLFRPQNTNVSEIDNTTDLSFALIKSDFVTESSSKTFTLNVSHTDNHNAHLNRLITYGLTPSGSSRTQTYSLLNDLSIKENENTDLIQEQVIQSGTTSSYNISFTNTADISSVFDSDQTSVILVENVMNSGDFDTQETTPVTNEGALAKYITKRVRTKDPVNQIRVFVDMFKTSGNEINVYVKDRPISTAEDFDSLPYKKLIRQEEFFSSDSSDIVTEEFRISGLDADSFAIKLTMTGTDRLNVPRITSIRVVGLGDV